MSATSSKEGPFNTSYQSSKPITARLPWQITGCSGRFIPWLPPPAETRLEILETIWEHLKEVLIKHLSEMYLLPSADESDGGALEGSSDEEEEKCFKGIGGL
jgi:hypothetical protein